MTVGVSRMLVVPHSRAPVSCLSPLGGSLFSQSLSSVLGVSNDSGTVWN